MSKLETSIVKEFSACAAHTGPSNIQPIQISFGHDEPEQVLQV